eukprot:scaffold20364_cov112-Isochrysis_galbana.AAC.1
MVVRLRARRERADSRGRSRRRGSTSVRRGVQPVRVAKMDDRWGAAIIAHELDEVMVRAKPEHVCPVTIFHDCLIWISDDVDCDGLGAVHVRGANRPNTIEKGRHRA